MIFHYFYSNPNLGKHRSSFWFFALLSWPCVSNCVFKSQRPSISSTSSIYSYIWNCFSFNTKFKQQRKSCDTSFAAATAAYEFKLATKFDHAFPNRIVFNTELYHPPRCWSPKVAAESRSPCRFPLGLEFNVEQALEKPIWTCMWRK